jgi:uncharacterized protein (TIGR03435 family)
MRRIESMSSLLALAMLSLPCASAGAQREAPAAMAEARPSFDVASIKPTKPGDGRHNWNGADDRLSVENYTLRRLIRTAYGLKSDSQVLGGPDWMGKQAFDIEAKYGDEEIAKLQKMTGRERFHEVQLAVQALLAERFQLQISQETRTIPVYELVVAKTGPKLTPSAPQLDDEGKPKAEPNHSLRNTNGHLTAIAMSMSGFADWFVNAPECDRVVIDRTGLAGDYDFKLDWTADNGQGIPQDAQFPGLFTALHEQLGLELKPDKAPVDVVVVANAVAPEFD